LERVPGGRVSKTVPELGACVSAPSEVRRCGHGVADTVFAFRTPGRPRELAGLPTVGGTSFTHWVKSVTLCGRMLSGGFRRPHLTAIWLIYRIRKGRRAGTGAFSTEGL